jgi:hypothetical protein
MILLVQRFAKVDCLNTALSSGMTSLQDMVASARSVGWGSNEVVIPVPYPSVLMCNMETQLIHPIDHTLHSHSR